MISPRLVVLLVLAALSLAPPLSAQSSPGVTFEMTVEASDSVGGPAQQQRGRGWMTRRHARVDMSGASGVPVAGAPAMGENVSVLVDATGSDEREVVVLNHDEKQFMRPSRMMAQMREMMQALPTRPEMTLSVGELRVDTLGPGEPVDGFATARYRVKMDVTMTVSMMGESQQLRFDSEGTGDYATELSEFVDPMLETAPLKAMLGMFGDTPELRATVQRLVDATPKGLGVRSEARIVMGTPTGTHTIVSRMAVTSIRRADVPDSTFAIPSGYTELQTPAPGDER